MRHVTHIRVGPRSFRIGSDWRAPVEALENLYRAYPPSSGIAHFTVRLEARRWWRRFLRPQVAIAGDHTLPDALPVSLDHALLAAEMAMNLQMALGERRYLLLHASTVERGGQALVITGDSGSGKSTLAALLATRGWRFMGDEFALIDPQSGLAHPFPRPSSLKNEAIGVMEAVMPQAQFGPLICKTAKGDIRHLVPDADAIAAMDVPARPALILFPRFGAAAETRPVGPAEGFVRLTQASTNYPMLGEAGFDALVRLVSETAAWAIDYPDTAAALAQVEALL